MPEEQKTDKNRKSITVIELGRIRCEFKTLGMGLSQSVGPGPIFSLVRQAVGSIRILGRGWLIKAAQILSSIT